MNTSLWLDQMGSSPLLIWCGALLLAAAIVLALLTWWRQRVGGIWQWGALAVVGLAGVGTTLLTFANLHQDALRKYETMFRIQAITRTNMIGNSFNHLIDDLGDTAHLFEASEEVREDEFARYISSMLDGHSGSLAMLWCPCIHAVGLAGVQVPVDYCQPPLEWPWLGRGTDLVASPLCWPALEEAAKSGCPVATEPFAIPGTKSAMAVQVFMPVYRGASPRTEAERLATLQGFVVGIYDIGEILQQAIAKSPLIGLSVTITDLDAPPDLAVVATLPSRFGLLNQPQPVFSQRLQFANSDWCITIVPSVVFRQTNWSEWHASSLVLGFLLTLLTLLYLHQLQIGRLHAEKLVAERTQQLEAKQASLAESETRHRIVADNTYTWEFWLAPDGNYVYVSPSCERISGYAAAAFIANPGLMRQIIHPDDRPLYESHRVGEQDLEAREIEFRIIRADGSVRWLAHACQPLFDQANRLLGIRGSNRDVTHQHGFQRLQMARNQAFDKIAAGSRLEEMLAAFVEQVVQGMPGYAVAIDLLDESRLRLQTVASSGLPAAFLRMTSGIAVGPASASSGAAVHWRRRTVVADLATHPNWTAFRQAANQAGIAAGWAEPVFSNGEVVGALAIYASRPMSPGEEEQEMLSEAGRLAGLVIEHARVVQNLRDQDVRIRHLGDNLPAGAIYQLLRQPGGSSQFIYLSEGIETIVGLSMVPLLDDAEPLFRRLTNNDRSRMAAAEQAAVASHSMLDLKVRLTVSQTVRWLHFRAAPHRQNDGAILWDGIILDVTEQAQAEQELRNLGMAVEQSPVIVVITDPRGNIEFVNPSFEKATGYSRAEAVGQNPRILKSGVHPSEFYQNLWSTVLDGKVWKGELCNRRKDGTLWWELASITAIRDADGSISHLLAVKEDITARKQAEGELEKAKTQAEEANRAKSLFLANMSHEIRTPLNAILGFSQLLRHDPAVTLQQAQRLDSISRGGEHLLALINDILEMSKIEAGRIIFNPAPFNLRGLFDDLEMMFRLRTDAKHLSFSVEHLGELPERVEADEGKLRQILVNLLGNAIKFTDKGCVVLRVRSLPLDNAVRLVVEIVDTGPGIAADEMARLFRPFAQTSSGIKAGGGTGLGLAISREFARIMEGEITVDSQPGRGSTFIFQVVLRLTSKPVPAIDTRQVIGLQPGQPPCRILIVDDNEENRNLLVEMLKPVGFDIRQAADGVAAVAEFNAWHPQVILMDLRMPVMDGLEAICRIRSDAGQEAVKIIAITASAFDEDRQAVSTAGADGFIAKPFRESELFERLRGLAGVEYVYATMGAAASEDRDPPGPAVALPAAFAASIRMAVQNGDLEAMEAVISQLETSDPVAARHLRQLVTGFEYERLLRWLEASGT